MAKIFLGIIFLITVPTIWASEPDTRSADFKIVVDGNSYNVISAVPTVGGEKSPLVIYIEGKGKGGLGKYELRKLAKFFAEEGFTFWAPERKSGGSLKEAISIARKILELALVEPRVDQANIAMVGYSQGAKAAFLVGLPADELKALCLLGFGDRLRSSGQVKSIRESLKEMDLMRIHPKTLIMIAQNDEVVDIDDGLFLATALEWAGNSVKIISYPGYRHEDLCGKNKYLDDLLKFLKETLH